MAGCFHGNESISTANYIGQISFGLMHTAAIEISSAVQAKRYLLLLCTDRKKILHPETGCFPLMSAIPKAFPLPSVSKSSVISG